MSELTGLDVEAVLRDHEIRWLGSVRPRAKCGAPGCEWAVALLTGDAVEDAHRAHVATVLNEHIVPALVDAWAEGAFYFGGSNAEDWYFNDGGQDANPYRASLAATEGDRQ